MTYEAVAEAHGLEYTPLDERPAALRLASAVRLRARRVGEIFTTGQVTPAASAITHDDEDGEAEEAEDVCHAL